MCLTDNKGEVSVAITKWAKGKIECENLLKYGDKPIEILDPAWDKEGFLQPLANIKVQDSKLYFILHNSQKFVFYRYDLAAWSRVSDETELGPPITHEFIFKKPHDNPSVI
jgi:hypothetical protein